MPEYQQEIGDTPPDQGGGYYGDGYSVGEAITYSNGSSFSSSQDILQNFYFAHLYQEAGVGTFDLTWIPRDGNYGGNGPNDAWLKWQSYIDFYIPGGRTLVRGPADAAYIRQLLADYIAQHPDSDPLNLKPQTEQDDNALTHDLTSFGGAVTHVLGNLAYAAANFVQGLVTGSLYALASVPFIGALASVYHVALGLGTAAGEIGGGIVSAGADLYGGFRDAVSNIASGNFSAAISSVVGGIAKAFSTLGDALESAFKALFPVVIDLDGDGIHLVSAADSHVILHSDDGDVRYSGWVGGGDGILAFDENANGIADGYQEFGLARFAPGANSDLAGLGAFDTNGDSLFSAADEQFSAFLIWVDANGDGVCQEGEAQSLVTLGIESIALALNGDYSTNAGNYIANTTLVTFADGTVHAGADVAFASSGASDQSRMLSSTITSHVLGSGLEVITLSVGGGPVVLEASDLDAGTTSLVIVSSMDGDTVTLDAGVAATFLGSQGDDRFIGSDESSTFRGGGGSNTFEGGTGGDTYILDAGSDRSNNIRDAGGPDTYLLNSESDLQFLLDDGDLLVLGADGFQMRVEDWAGTPFEDEIIVNGVTVDLAILFANGQQAAGDGVTLAASHFSHDWFLAA